MRIRDILNFLRPDSDNGNDNIAKKKSRSKVTNKVLYKELIQHFETDMEELSVGRRILYPMSFNILLHPDDYDRVEESLKYILPEVISGFYASIKKKCKNIADADATNPATYWFFQFASSSIKTADNQDSIIVPGEIVTVAHLTTFDIKKAQHGTRSANIKLSVKCQNSNVNENNINQEALLGMDILTNNAYAYNFDNKMSEQLNDIESTRRGGENDSLATLTYSDGAVNVHLDMIDNLVIVSGPEEKRNLENILIVNNNAVSIGHIQIRYIKESNKFQLCAYSKTRLNMREVPLSVGGAPIWKDMSYNSDIFLNNSVNIKFRATDFILNRNK